MEDATAHSSSSSSSGSGESRAPHVSRRGTLTAVMALAAAVAFKPRDVQAAEEAAVLDEAAGAAAASPPQTVYFGYADGAVEVG